MNNLLQNVKWWLSFIDRPTPDRYLTLLTVEGLVTIDPKISQVNRVDITQGAPSICYPFFPTFGALSRPLAVHK